MMLSDASSFPSLSTILKSFSVSDIIALAIVALSARWILRGIYRVYFHPLRSFPGPKFAAFTRLPHLAAIATGELPQYIARLHEAYGAVVRVSPDELSFIDAHAWRDIYGHGPKEGKGSAPPKNWSRYGKSLNGSPSIIIIQDPVEHARARKIFTPAFSDRALTQQAPLFIKYADQLVRSLKDGGKDSGKFDMVRMYNFATFDVMGDLTFGEPLHMLDNAEYDPWVRAIFANIKRGVQLGLIYNYYPLVASTFRALFHRTVAKTQYTHMNFSATRVTKRLEKGRESAGIDLWDLVLAQEEKGKAGLTRGEMDTNSGLFMVAGTETTATLLSGLTYLLLSTSNGEYMIKLVDEIRGAFTSSDDISMEATQALPYLNACIKEALRMYPPVPIGLPHLTPKEGSTICGVFVPSGVTVAAPHYAMYTSPTNFTTPRVFLPERWLGDERFATDNRSALQPFSVGSRDCLGKNMAYHEMRLLIAKVLYNCDLELCDESRDWIERQKVFILWEKLPLMVKVTPVA